MSTISVDYDVLNQRGSPAWFTDTFANIPTAGYVGRMFISKDTFAFYRDTGTGWDLIGGPGIGTLTGSGVVGQVSFFNGTQVLAGNNNLFWDNTNSRLGINTTTPGQALDIHSTGNTLVQLNNTTTANSNISFQNQNVAKWRIGNVYNGGANSFDIQNAVLSNTPISIDSASSITTFSTTTNMSALLQTQVGIYLNQGVQANAIAPYTAISGYPNGLFICPNSGTGYYLTFPASSGYVYTFPASTGTIALTSNLSSYLPLAGGTLTGTLFMNGTGTNNAYIEFQNASTSKWKVGNTYNAGANSFDIFNAVLSTTALSISNSSNVITMDYVIKSEAAILIKNGATITAVGYTGVSSTASGLLINLGNTGFNSTLSFPASNQTFTYPSATGTLALTSDLSGYLPLTGGTLTGALVINPTNTLTIGLDVASNTTRFRSDNLEGFKRQLEITMGSGTLVQLTAKGYLANYGTDMAFYTATTGGTNASPGIYITGTNNRVGIKTGTPANDLDVAGTFGVSGLSSFASNVTIGSPTTDPTLNLNGDNTGGDSYINFKADSGGTKVQLLGTKNGGTGGRLTFKTLQSSVLTTAMKIEDGDITMGVAPLTNGHVFYNPSGAGAYQIVSHPAGTGTGYSYTIYQYNGSSIGGINQLGTTGVQYNVTSDYRLKENITPIENAIDKILNINAVKYKWKNTQNEFGEGFIAHELQEIIPYAVSGIKDAVNEDGTYKLQQVDYSKLVPTLVKAIQELNEKLVKNNIN